MKKYIITTIITILLGGIYYYVMLPAINLRAPSFYAYLLFILFVYLININLLSITSVISAKTSNIKTLNDLNFEQKLTTVNKVLMSIISLIFITLLLNNFVLSPIFFAGSYYDRINIVDADFYEDIPEVDFNKLPLVDKASTTKLGDRTMGTMSQWVSQFYVSDLYTQINYGEEILRVTPLEYEGIIKYFTNKEEGIKGYITVNSVTGESNLKQLDEGMKYMPSAFFSEDLYRKIVFKYPTKILGEATFEIDEEGMPYWIVPTYKYVGIGTRKDVEGSIVLNAITGESTYYKVSEVPSWVDQVYPTNLILEQVRDWGLYLNGFMNSLFGQKNVVATTDGYNYLIVDEDVYLYTGITSVLADDSNLGFILVNLRTKESNYYPFPGAEEYSAMSSAQGLVQEKSYIASFPLLINLNNKATYMLSLKDAAGLVKMYAFVDVEDYQIVSVTDASKGILQAKEDYLLIIGTSDNDSDDLEEEIQIKEIYNATIDGNTYYYILDTKNNKYILSIKIDNEAPFYKVGDKLSVIYTTGDIRVIKKIK